MSEFKIDVFGSKLYYNDKGEYHREDGPACEYIDGSKSWFLNGKRHRENGPAIQNFNGTKYWYFNGKLHREDGPAIQFYDGSKAWYYKGVYVNCNSNEEFLKLIKLKVFW